MQRYQPKPRGTRGTSIRSPRGAAGGRLCLIGAAVIWLAGLNLCLAQEPAPPRKAPPTPARKAPQRTTQPRGTAPRVAAQPAPRAPGAGQGQQTPNNARPPGVARGTAQGQRPAAAQPGAAGQPAEPPAPPFVLTPEELEDLRRMLADWEARSATVKMFKCELKRWEFDNVFNKKTVALGELKYRAPDKGMYKVRNEETGEIIEHWVCDGKSIFEFNYAKKQLIERRLPAELQGKAIANGPLPFIFGAKAQTLEQRYFLRLKEPPEKHADKICIEAYPKLASDAANFRRAELLLTQQGMQPFALQLDLPNGKNVTVHQFYNVKPNDPLNFLVGDFAKPKPPAFWKHIIEDPDDPGADAQPSTADQRGRATVPPPALAPQPPGKQARRTLGPNPQ